MDYLEKARRVIQLEMEELQRLHAGIGESFTQAIGMIRETLDAGHKVVVAGIGKSYNIGHKIAATFNSTGTTCVVLNTQNALHGDLGLINDGDTIFALSYSGETSELLALLPHLRSFSVKIIAMTGGGESTLAKNADAVLDVRVEREACPLNLAPTSSSTLMLVLGDALAMVMLEARGFGEKDFARLHPSGTLGRVLLTRVSDIMRKDAQLAKVSATDTVRHTLNEMTRVRSGAAIVIKPDGALDGVFTHGDFVRAIQKDQTALDHPVSTYMTKNPVSIESDRLATETLKILGKNRVDDIVVIDTNGLPVGLVDTQDLSRLKII